MRRRSRLLAVPVLAAAVSLHACSLLEPEEETPRSPRRLALERSNDLEPEASDAAPGEAPSELTEEVLAVGSPLAVTATPAATSTAMQGITVGANSESTPTPLPTATAVAPTADSESVLGLIGPTTPPQTAAALRLVEEGRGLLEKGQLDRAEDRFERAVAIDPGNVQGYYFLAKAHFLAHRYDQAEGFLSRAIGLGARTDPVWQARVAALQGQILEAASRYPEARQAYQRALQLDPHNAAAQAGVTRLNRQ